MTANYNLNGPFHLPMTPNQLQNSTQVTFHIIPGTDLPYNRRSKKQWISAHGVCPYVFDIIAEGIKIAVSHRIIDITVSSFGDDVAARQSFCHAVNSIQFRVKSDRANVMQEWQRMLALSDQEKYELAFIARTLARNICIKKYPELVNTQDTNQDPNQGQGGASGQAQAPAQVPGQVQG
ncbi:hypothetical protein EX30DRAFT_341080 [Ascodesmis nigricans]|uniref:Uncharacterized protein n=1 Tax=Ascodesmis nigricans TaxID=341454 RepID=A0A4S2MWR5_9PEZI|nr:hypothetical protein EX30DRAFT_341080 [Ascodesmis nigricans]